MPIYRAVFRGVEP